MCYTSEETQSRQVREMYKGYKTPPLKVNNFKRNLKHIIAPWLCTDILHTSAHNTAIYSMDISMSQRNYEMFSLQLINLSVITS